MSPTDAPEPGRGEPRASVEQGELRATGLEPAGEAGLLPVEVARPRWPLVLLAMVCAVALLAAGGAVAVLSGLGGHRAPAEDSVDVGFAQDMMVHHQQAIEMAGWVRDHDTNPDVRLVAYDIETQQLTEVGLFKGWLDGWGLLPTTDRDPMNWMSGQHPHLQSGGLMPGMASTAELGKLKTLSGKELDVFFLQLMIRHHQGGIPMAQYAADHASTDYVRTAAKKMADAQSIDVVNMERMLRDLGGTPLPPPA